MTSRRVKDDPSEKIPADPSLGRRIQEALDRGGLTKSDLQRALGVRWATVHDWVRDKSTPNAENLKQIAEVTGVECNDGRPLETRTTFDANGRGSVEYERMERGGDRARFECMEPLRELTMSPPPTKPIYITHVYGEQAWAPLVAPPATPFEGTEEPTATEP